jgi:hypothetical protein
MRAKPKESDTPTSASDGENKAAWLWAALASHAASVTEALAKGEEAVGTAGKANSDL